MRYQGPLSRAELARRLVTSRAAATKAVTPLLENGILIEVGKGKLSMGRSPRLLSMNPEFAVVAGVDLGASNLRIALARMDGTVFARRSMSTPRNGSLEREIGEAVMSLHRDTSGNCPLVTVAIGTPGVVQDGRVRYAPNLPEIESNSFIPNLQEIFPCPIEIHNDVNIAAFGEATALSTCQSLALLSIGTGLGAGFILNGEIWSGSSGRAGEIGYLPFASPVGTTLEEVLSGTGLARLLRYFGGSGGAREALEHPGEAAQRARAIFFEALETALFIICFTFDPKVIVISGGAVRSLGPHLPAIIASAREKVPFLCAVELSRLGDRAAERGAISMALEKAYADLLSSLTNKKMNFREVQIESNFNSEYMG